MAALIQVQEFCIVRGWPGLCVRLPSNRSFAFAQRTDNVFQKLARFAERGRLCHRGDHDDFVASLGNSRLKNPWLGPFSLTLLVTRRRISRISREAL